MCGLPRLRAGQLGEITAPQATYWVHPVCYAWSMEGRLGLRSDAAGHEARAYIEYVFSRPSHVMPGNEEDHRLVVREGSIV